MCLPQNALCMCGVFLKVLRLTLQYPGLSVINPVDTPPRNKYPKTVCVLLTVSPAHRGDCLGGCVSTFTWIEVNWPFLLPSFEQLSPCWTEFPKLVALVSSFSTPSETGRWNSGMLPHCTCCIFLSEGAPRTVSARVSLASQG